MFKSVNGGKLPTKGSKYSACVDLYANEDVIIGAGETKLIPLGVAIDLDGFKKNNRNMFITQKFKLISGNDCELVEEFCDEQWKYWLSSHYLQLMLRSSLSKELIITNGVGVVDLDYTDEIMVRVHNPQHVKSSSSSYSNGITNIRNSVDIKKGDRVAQITLLEHKAYLFGIECEDERTGGFGSTGK